MKKLLIGLLALGSLTVFADDSGVSCRDFHNKVNGLYKSENPMTGEDRIRLFTKNGDGTLNEYRVFTHNTQFMGDGNEYQAGDKVLTDIWILKQSGNRCKYNKKPSPNLLPFYHNMYDENEYLTIYRLEEDGSSFELYGLMYEKIQ